MIVFEKGQERVLSRKKALGFNKIVLDDNVSLGDEISFNEVGDDLVVVKSDSKSDDIVYQIITKEIGLYGKKQGVKSSIKVILCDDCMLVTLVSGSIALRLDDNIMVASNGVDAESLPNCVLSDIYWLSYDNLLSFVNNVAKFSKQYPYDYQYILELDGEISNGMSSIHFKPAGQAIDISQGQLAVVESQLIAKEEAKKARDMMKMVKSTQSYEDEYEETEYYDEDDDDEDSGEYDICS